ncbi:hypothetical protein MMC26_002954 [Xylographa opegraphella]|nr:hypothetical protein [Xylographa opegraphella]
MEETHRSSIFIAPLSIIKHKPTGSNTTSHSSSTSSSSFPIHSQPSRAVQVTRRESQMTPPLTPQTSVEVIGPQDQPQQLQFHNYLRAFYPFHPHLDASSSTVTLPLNEGDLVLVHSVQPNGWADGTLLMSGARGWLPTNYCVAYDHEPMCHLMKALTAFWDLVYRTSDEARLVFLNGEYMRGLVAGVRYLLAQTRCLTKEDHLIETNASLRRNRKALLADLQVMIKMSQGPIGDMDDDDWENLVMMAFKMVLRGVRFFDLWNDEVELETSIDASIAGMDAIDIPQSGSSAPLTPPADRVCFGAAGDIDPVTDDQPNATQRVSTVNDGATIMRESREQASKRYSRASPILVRPGTARSNNDNAQPSSAQSRRLSLLYRPSSSRVSTHLQSQDLVSEKLSAAHDNFLSFLGSFLGLHLPSRTSTEVLITTHQAVLACQRLLNIVDTVCERDFRRSESLDTARSNMYGKLSDLVYVAKDIFQPAYPSEPESLSEDDGKRLIDAATLCIRSAGDCVAQTRFVLERIGDFDFEVTGPGVSAFDGVEFLSSQSTEEQGQSTEASTFEDSASVPSQPLNRPPPPPSQGTATTLSTIDATPPQVPANSEMPVLDHEGNSTHPSNRALPHSDDALPGAADDSPVSQPSSDDSNTPNFSKVKGYRTMSSDLSSSGSTYIGSMRDSERSLLSSTSTRVTSPDIFSRTGAFQSMSDSFSGSESTLDDETLESEAKIREKTYAHELVFNKDGQISGGTLPALIERLTTDDSTPDALFVSTFYLTFRLFTTPQEFAQALIDRFNYVGDNARNATPVRLRVFNVFKGWLESHWRMDCDRPALDLILPFAAETLANTIPSTGKRLMDLALKVSDLNGPLVPRLVSSMGKTNTSVAKYVAPDTPMPTAIITRSQLSSLRNWKKSGSHVSILDFDPLELARQLTLKVSRLYCSILPEELIALEWMKKSASMSVNIRAMSTLSTDLANLVAECVLQFEDNHKRAKLIKQWVKIASRCLDLNNYDSLMAIVCSLNSTAIQRLTRTWPLVSAKTVATLEKLRAIVDISKNYTVLRQRLQNQVAPCLPFVGIYLTDLAFVDMGNTSTRQLPGTGSKVEESTSVINFDKHMKTAKVISELQRFQIPYRFQEIPELQTWMQDQLVRVRSSDDAGIQNHYRRSLLLEPREAAHAVPKGHSKDKEGSRDKIDLEKIARGLRWQTHAK